MKHADKCCQGEGERDPAVALVNTFVSCGSFAKNKFRNWSEAEEGSESSPAEGPVGI